MNDSVLSSKLKKSAIYKELAAHCKERTELSSVMALVNDVGAYALNVSKTIISNMPEYTLHDQEHIFNMLYIAERLITKDVIKRLSPPDLLMILLAIFLHDIGMSPKDELVKAWKGTLSDDKSATYQTEIDKFHRFRQTHLQELNDIQEFKDAGSTAKAQLLEDRIITEYIRITHPERARKMIAEDWGQQIRYLDTDLAADLADICFSHNEGYTDLLKMETVKMCDEDTYLCLPFVAVILRLADIIDFDPKRTPAVLFSHLTIENPVSLQEWQKHQAINAWTIKGNSLVFSAQCTHPAIEATIHGFCNLIDEELRNCTLVLANLNSDFCDVDMYKIPLPSHVNRDKIKPIKDIASGKPVYRYHDTKFTLNKRQVVDLLMGTKLYGDPEVALRELIQNSIDACLLRESLSGLWNENYVPNIEVSLYTVNDIDYLKVVDNGIGMNQHIIDNYYTNIGQSYYNSTEFYELMADVKNAFKPISRFGIGILACFMVCDNMQVNTRRVIGHYQSDDPVKVSIEGYDSLFVITDSDKQEPGTETILKLRKTHPWKRLKENQFVNYVRQLVPLPPFAIDIVTTKHQETYSPESFEQLDLSLENDYSWDAEKNIKVFNFDLNEPLKGFRGKASVAYIAKNKSIPVPELDITSKQVLVDGEMFDLSSSISYGRNCISKSTTSITVNEDGEIGSDESHRKVFNSKAFLSIHGIDVPCKLFEDYTNFGQKAVLNYPFPIRFRLDIGATNDLNLNSARTQIIYDDVWLDFERDLLTVICQKMKAALPEQTWNELKQIYLSKNIESSLHKIVADS